MRPSALGPLHALGPLGPLVLVTVVALVATTASCGSKQDPGAGPFGDTHGSPDSDGPASPDGPEAGATIARGAQRLGRQQAEAALAAALASDATAAALVYGNRVVVTGGTLPEAQRDALIQAIDGLPAKTLGAVYRELQPEVFPAELVAYRLALIAAHIADMRSARTWLERSGGAERVVGEDAVTALRASIDGASDRARQVDTGVIAVALPLSGPFAALGTEMAAAIEFAGRERGAARNPVRFELLDTRGESAGAIAAVDRAFHDLRALAVIGPVGDRESAAAARRAAELGIPIALLAPGAATGSPRAGVFRLWASPEWEAHEAARLAIEMGHDRPAILAPRDEHGARAARAFTEAAAARGITVVTSGTYDPTASDLEPDIKSFLGLDPRTNERLRRHLRRRGKSGWKTFSPDVAFDLLYIPDEYRRAALVAAFLPYFNVEVRSRDVMDVIALRRKHRGRVPQVVQLLGSSGWHHESIIPRGGPVLEGALLVDVYSGGENEEFATEEGAIFAERYSARTGRMPSALTAQAHDAALLVLQARKQALARGDRPGRSAPGGARGELIRALAGARLDDGVCGPAQMSTAGTLEREAVVLRIDGGSFVLHEY